MYISFVYLEGKELRLVSLGLDPVLIPESLVVGDIFFKWGTSPFFCGRGSDSTTGMIVGGATESSECTDTISSLEWGVAVPSGVSVASWKSMSSISPLVLGEVGSYLNVKCFRWSSISACLSRSVASSQAISISSEIFCVCIGFR